MSCYQVGGIEDKDPLEQSYRSLLGQLMEVNSTPLVEAYTAMEGLLEQVDNYVQVSTILTIIMI